MIKTFNKLFIYLIIFSLLLSFISAQELSLDRSETFDTMPEEYLTFGRATLTERGLSDIDTLDKWSIKDNRLEVTDFDNKTGGSNVFLFTDKIYTSNYTFSATVGRNEYRYGWDSVGLVFGYKHNGYFRPQINTTFSSFKWTTSNMQGWYNLGEPTHSFKKNYNLNEPHKLQVNVYDNRVDYFINDEFVLSSDKTPQPGYLGFYIWDCNGKNDAEFEGVSYFDNALIYSTPDITTSVENNTYTTTINSTQPIKEVEFVVEEEINNSYYEEGLDAWIEDITYEEYYTNTTIIDENITDIIIDTDFIEKDKSIILRWYYKVVDFFDNIFKSEAKTII